MPKDNLTVKSLFIKIGAHANRYKWLLGIIYMNCEGIRGEENVLKMRCAKEVISKAAPNDTAYKRWSCHSGLKLLCKLCRT